jgi:hypothetical protein
VVQEGLLLVTGVIEYTWMRVRHYLVFTCIRINPGKYSPKHCIRLGLVVIRIEWSTNREECYGTVRVLCGHLRCECLM